MEPLQPEDPEGLGRFRIEARLDAGGMGRVHLASTPEGRRAAVKTIRHDLAGDTGFRHRFRREVSAALSVAGLFTARMLDADPDGDPPWLATEFVDGPSLGEAVATRGPMPAGQVLGLARGLAEALGAIHAAGLVHRDLKPANVLLSPTGPKVIDFGIARSVGGTRARGGAGLSGDRGHGRATGVAAGDARDRHRVPAAAHARARRRRGRGRAGRRGGRGDRARDPGLGPGDVGGGGPDHRADQRSDQRSVVRPGQPAGPLRRPALRLRRPAGEPGPRPPSPPSRPATRWWPAATT